MNSDRYSSLVAGLRDCRLATKRNPDTGEYNPDISNGDPGNWLACIGYFTVLDQIGSAFKPTTGPLKGRENSIVYALRHFAKTAENEGTKFESALKALRNAFTHDFNLLNIPDNKNKFELERHKFQVHSDPKNSRIIKFPITPWNGDIDGKNFYRTDDATQVNLYQFGSLVEAIYLEVFKGIKTGEVENSIAVHTLVNKYTFVISRNPSVRANV